MNPVAGSLCIAPYEGQYFRAKIAAVRGNEAQVYFVDYGNSEVVNFGVIRQLLPGFKALEFQVLGEIYSISDVVCHYCLTCSLGNHFCSIIYDLVNFFVQYLIW